MNTFVEATCALNNDEACDFEFLPFEDRAVLFTTGTRRDCRNINDFICADHRREGTYIIDQEDRSRISIRSHNIFISFDGSQTIIVEEVKT